MKRILIAILLSSLSLKALSQVGISKNPEFTPTEDLDVDGNVKVRKGLSVLGLAPSAGERSLIIDANGQIDTVSGRNLAISSYGTGSYFCAPNSAKALIPGLTRTLTLLVPSYVTISTDGGIVNSVATNSLVSSTEISINVNGNTLEGGGTRRVLAINSANMPAVANWNLGGTILLPAGSHTVTVNATGGTGTASAIVSSNGITISSFTVAEGFSAGTAAPAGWTFTSIGATYTSSGNFGQSSPALMMDATGDRVITPVFTGTVSSLSFWIKGLTTNAGSALLVEGSSNGTSWTTIQNITNSLPSSGTTMTYTASSTPALSAGMNQFRFTFSKSSGNLSFDDVTVTTAQSASYNVNRGQMSLQILAK